MVKTMKYVEVGMILRARNGVEAKKMLLDWLNESEEICDVSMHCPDHDYMPYLSITVHDNEADIIDCTDGCPKHEDKGEDDGEV